MCTINTPFGLYRYIWLAMGIKILPHMAQAIINKILDRRRAEGYIDNCSYWSNDSFDEHQVILRMGWPNKPTQVRSFIGTVNFYKSSLLRLIHLISPLMEMSGNLPLR